jgi:D-alanyl-D-alanine carboxypeptidase
MIFSHERELFFDKQTVLKINIPEIVKPIMPPPPISAEGLYVVELESFAPIAKKNENETFFPASTTKVLTAITSRRLFDLDKIIKIKNPKQIGQTMGLTNEEEITVENLLYGILVQSGNDAAYALAEAYSYDEFMKEMNKIGREIGMSKSYFSNPAGLDEPLQRSTPFELALVSRKLLEDGLLRKIIATKQITVSDANYTIFHPLTNVNSLLGEIPGLGGLKTGYTELAKENLISYYSLNGKKYLIVILKSDDRFEDTRNIVTWLNSGISVQKPPLEYVIY